MLTPEKAETLLRTRYGFRIETGCIREACNLGWIPCKKTRMGYGYPYSYQVTVDDVVSKYIKK